MFVQTFIAIFANRSLPGSQRKMRKNLMKTSAEIILSLLHSFFAPGYVIKIKLNLIYLHLWLSWQSILT